MGRGGGEMPRDHLALCRGAVRYPRSVTFFWLVKVFHHTATSFFLSLTPAISSSYTCCQLLPSAFVIFYFLFLLLTYFPLTNYYSHILISCLLLMAFLSTKTHLPTRSCVHTLMHYWIGEDGSSIKISLVEVSFLRNQPTELCGCSTTTKKRYSITGGKD